LYGQKAIQIGNGFGTCDVVFHMSKSSHVPIFTRRRFIQGTVGLALTAASTIGYARVIEPRWFNIDKLELPIPNLPSALDGKRIAQLSDIHLSQYFSPERLRHAIDAVSRLNPDWLVFTGDFVGDHAEDAEGLVEPLRALAMPLFAVFGNHDYWSHNPTVDKYLHEANVRVLLNSSVQLDNGLWLAGVDDLWSGRPDLSAALRDVPKNAPTVLLSHEPDFFDQVLREQAPIALQLSGHSHGGQVRLPTTRQDSAGFFSYAPILPMYGRNYPIGLRQIDGRYIYTNRGLGVWPIPLRINCRPEITLVTLRSA
jgi:predicted MPP superfamily phosphohydrolase